MKSVLFSFFFLFGLLFINAPAMAHGGGGIEVDQCVANVGSYRMHFSAYQPHATGGKELCWDLPAAGNAILVFDLVERVLRDRPVEVRVVKQQSKSTGPVSYETVVEKPVQTYPQGVIEVEAKFPNPGEYTAVVTVGGDQPLLFKTPVRVALAGGQATEWMIAGVLVAGIIAFVFWNEYRKKGVNKEAQA